MSSSILVAFLITIILILLVMFLYPAKKGTGTNILVRLFVYSFLSSMLIIFLHDGVIRTLMKEKFRLEDQMHVGGSNGSSSLLAPTVNIAPTVGGEEIEALGGVNLNSIDDIIEAGKEDNTRAAELAEIKAIEPELPSSNGGILGGQVFHRNQLQQNMFSR